MFNQLTTYTIPSNFQALDSQTAVGQLRKHLFAPIDDLAFMEQAYGVCKFEDFMEFYDNCLRDAIRDRRYVAFGLRLDKRSVPAGLLERRHREKIDAWHEAQEKAMARQAALPGTGAHDRAIGDPPKLSKARRRELRQEAKQELLQGVMPNPKMWPCVVDIDSRRVWFGCTSAPAVRAFEAPALKAFGIYLVPTSPAHRLYESGLELVDASFAPGKGFLTWLWRRIIQYQTNDEPMELASPISPQPDQVRISVHDIALEQYDNGKRERLRANGADAASWEEVETAIRSGREVVGLGLELKSHDDVYRLETTSGDLAIRSLKLPKPAKPAKDEDPDPYGDFLLTMGHLEAVQGYLDDLWSIYVARLREDGRVQHRREVEGELPPALTRAQSLSNDHPELFEHVESLRVSLADGRSHTVIGDEELGDGVAAKILGEPQEYPEPEAVEA